MSSGAICEIGKQLVKCFFSLVPLSAGLIIKKPGTTCFTRARCFNNLIHLILWVVVSPRSSSMYNLIEEVVMAQLIFVPGRMTKRACSVHKH